MHNLYMLIALVTEQPHTQQDERRISALKMTLTKKTKFLIKTGTIPICDMHALL